MLKNKYNAYYCMIKLKNIMMIMHNNNDWLIVKAMDPITLIIGPLFRLRQLIPYQDPSTSKIHENQENSSLYRSGSCAQHRPKKEEIKSEKQNNISYN